MRRILAVAAVGAVLLGMPLAVFADTTVTVDPSATWNGYVNVSELPSNGGAYLWGSGWGLDALSAVFSPPTLTLGPATVDDPAEYWYVGGGAPGAAGNKNMEANLYVEVTDSLSGQVVTFNGTVLTDTMVDPYDSYVFIKDFAADYSSFNQVLVPVVPGPFSVSLATDAGAGRHVQYGFQTIGPNVWPTDVDSKGHVVIEAVPEPASVLLIGMAVLAVGMIGRRRAR